MNDNRSYNDLLTDITSVEELMKFLMPLDPDLQPAIYIPNAQSGIDTDIYATLAFSNYRKNYKDSSEMNDDYRRYLTISCLSVPRTFEGVLIYEKPYNEFYKYCRQFNMKRVYRLNVYNDLPNIDRVIEHNRTFLKPIKDNCREFHIPACKLFHKNPGNLLLQALNHDPNLLNHILFKFHNMTYKEVKFLFLMNGFILNGGSNTQRHLLSSCEFKLSMFMTALLVHPYFELIKSKYLYDELSTVKASKDNLKALVHWRDIRNDEILKQIVKDRTLIEVLKDLVAMKDTVIHTLIPTYGNLILKKIHNNL